MAPEDAIHLATGVKVDVFVVGGDPFEARRRDGAISDRQWRDVIGIIRTQGVRLDRRELSTWAERLGVSDLLARALREGVTTR